jgi:mercuric ion binding protein
MRTIKALLVSVALAAFATALPAGLVAQEPPPADDPAAVQRIQFTVAGLSCPFCAYGIEKKLRREIVGLDSLGLDFKTGTVTLQVKDGTKVSDGQLRRVVNKAGFSVLGDIRRFPLVESPRPTNGRSGER